MQLSCGHVDIDRMIIHDDNPNQGYFFFLGGGGGGAGGNGGISHTLYHPLSYKSLSSFSH